MGIRGSRSGNMRVVNANVRRDPIVGWALDAIDPDPTWSYTDLAGHAHRWIERIVPTLVRVVDGHYWCELCRDEHETDHEECRECGEWIVPEVIHRGPHSFTVPGMLEAWVEVEITHAPGLTEAKIVVPRTSEEAEAIEQLAHAGNGAALIEYLRERDLL